MFLGSVPQIETSGGGPTVYVVQDNTTPDVAMQSSVLKAITKAGRPCMVSSASSQTYDPATGSTSAVPAEVWGVQALMSDYSAGEIDGSAIQRGDAKFLIPGVLRAPQIDDTLAFAGTAWRVIDITSVAPQGYPIIYTIQGRR